MERHIGSKREAQALTIVSEVMMEGDYIKLQKLLPHWMEHNEEHAQKFLEWAQKAHRLGLEETAKRLASAADLLRKATRELETAFQEMEGHNLA